MKKYIALIIMLQLCLLLLCACGKEKEELGVWEMPAVDARPTIAPTAMPVYGGGSPESYVWNEAEGFDMLIPGAPEDSLTEKYTHKQCLALFPYYFIPSNLFSESYASYPILRLQRTEHEVLLDPSDGSLAEHAYIEFVYLPQSRSEAGGVSVMAELCDYVSTAEIYQLRAFPHVSYPDGAKPLLSSYYLKDFVLAKCGDIRIAQILRLSPSSYFNDTAAAAAEAEANGEKYTPARQILLTITCGRDVSDEEFIAAVCSVLTYSDSSERLPVETSSLPGKGEKGAA